MARERLLTGVSKLTTTNSTVEEMRQQLRQLQPVLADKTEATTRLLEQVGMGVGCGCGWRVVRVW